MTAEPMEVRRALEAGTSLPYALIRSLSRVTLGPAPAEVDPGELLEARFFNETEEIRIFWDEDLGEHRAVRLTAGPEELCLRETCPLMNEAVFGREITLCREIAFDEDGQAYLSDIRLAGWKGGSV